MGMVTLTDVEVTHDYAHAKVYFTLLNQEHSPEETLVGLNRAAGFLRTQLAHRMRLRIVPQLHFVFDSFSRAWRAAFASDRGSGVCGGCKRIRKKIKRATVQAN